MILRGGGRRPGWKERSHSRGCRGSELMNDLSIVSLLGLEGTERQRYGHQWQAGTLLVDFKEFLEKKA